MGVNRGKEKREEIVREKARGKKETRIGKK